MHARKSWKLLLNLFFLAILLYNINSPILDACNNHENYFLSENHQIWYTCIILYIKYYSPIRLIFDVDPENLSPLVAAILDSNMAAIIILAFFIKAPPNIHLRA